MLLRLRLLPTPFALEAFSDVVDSPASFFVNAFEDFKDLFLLTTGDKALGGDGKGSNGDRCHSSVLDMGSNATDSKCIFAHHLSLLWERVGWAEWIDLCKCNKSSMIDETGDNRATLDEPGSMLV